MFPEGAESVLCLGGEGREERKRSWEATDFFGGTTEGAGIIKGVAAGTTSRLRGPALWVVE